MLGRRKDHVLRGGLQAVLVGLGAQRQSVAAIQVVQVKQRALGIGPDLGVSSV